MEQGPISPGRVGQQLGLSSGAVTALLQRLEQTGHIVRVDTEDGRRRDAQLTGNGRRAAHREFERLGRSIATQFAGEPAAQLLGAHRGDAAGGRGVRQGGARRTMTRQSRHP